MLRVKLSSVSFKLKPCSEWLGPDISRKYDEPLLLKHPDLLRKPKVKMKVRVITYAGTCPKSESSVNLASHADIHWVRHAILGEERLRDKSGKSKLEATRQYTCVGSFVILQGFHRGSMIVITQQWTTNQTNLIP